MRNKRKFFRKKKEKINENVRSSEPMLAECLLTASQAHISCIFQSKHAACRDVLVSVYFREKEALFLFLHPRKSLLFLYTILLLIPVLSFLKKYRCS